MLVMMGSEQKGCLVAGVHVGHHPLAALLSGVGLTSAQSVRMYMHRHKTLAGANVYDHVRYHASTYIGSVFEVRSMFHGSISDMLRI